MIINFDCKKCRQEFDCDVGKITVDKKSMRPLFEKDIVCPRCGKRSIDEVLLTELGQSQMTEATWNL
jgi:transcription elongation factor Elf1